MTRKRFRTISSSSQPPVPPSQEATASQEATPSQPPAHPSEQATMPSSDNDQSLNDNEIIETVYNPRASIGGYCQELVPQRFRREMEELQEQRQYQDVANNNHVSPFIDHLMQVGKRVLITMRQRQTNTTVPPPNQSKRQNPKLPTSDYRKPTTNSDVFSSSERVFALCLAFRLANALLVQTYFNPDEHWQALEVAHRIAFGYGHLTWEWNKGIRSFLHPMLFAVLYKVLALLGLDTPWFMQRAPRLLQSILSAVGDLYLYKLSDVLFGDCVAKWATVLTLVGLYHWPCMRVSSTQVPLVSRKWGLVLAALACAIRPTSAITWVYVGLLELFVTHEIVRFIFLEVAPIGVLVLGLTCLLDRWLYGSWVLVPLNFLKFNFLSSGGDYYGTHKWHWYFTQGFPVMLFSFLPFSIAGIMQSKQWKLFGLIAWVLGVYSVLGHKEFRFVMPVLPIALMFSGYAIAKLKTPDSPDTEKKRSLKIHIRVPSKMRYSILFLLLTNIPMALYMCLVHQRGTEDVMIYLSKEAHNDKVKSILFLMPCHATPYYSTLHCNLPMRFLDCSPGDQRELPDESDRFMMDPVSFVSEFSKNWSTPSHVVLFNAEERLLRDFLTSHSFKEVLDSHYAIYGIWLLNIGKVVVFLGLSTFDSVICQSELGVIEPQPDAALIVIWSGGRISLTSLPSGSKKLLSRGRGTRWLNNGSEVQRKLFRLFDEDVSLALCYLGKYTGLVSLVSLVFFSPSQKEGENATACNAICDHRES
ncbi:GPI mannosyltransferase 3 [Morella rubra]|uniref:Mannosyltransferase n=1 Tax=Morella rubra TaxID=262757 RepID=A0A6A1UWV2_9ROSI|nr:GPI mannosyltransferase 3 [Morella rubra]